jgi:hypothetical protein
VYSEVKEIIKNGMQRGVKYPNISPEILNWL